MTGYAPDLPPQQPNYGWTCPKCGRVYSPTTPQCWVCSTFPTTPNIDPNITVYSDNTQEPKP